MQNFGRRRDPNPFRNRDRFGGDDNDNDPFRNRDRLSDRQVYEKIDSSRMV